MDKFASITLTSIADYQDLRQSIRTVTQEPFLFSDTVENNIAFAIEDRPEDRLPKDQEYFPEFAQQARLQEEVDKFPLPGTDHRWREGHPAL